MSGSHESIKLKRRLEKAGFTVERTGGGNWKASKPGRTGFVIFGFTDSGHNTWAKTIKRLRALGYKGD
jgi:hypothetical protein